MSAVQSCLSAVEKRLYNEYFLLQIVYKNSVGELCRSSFSAVSERGEATMVSVDANTLEIRRVFRVF